MSGPAGFARDRDSSRQVWSAEEGYPGDPAYRDFYRDAGFEVTTAATAKEALGLAADKIGLATRFVTRDSEMEIR